MNTANWTHYLQIGANIGILIGLVLVGIQIRDTNRIASAQFEYDAWAGPMDTRQIIMGEGLAAAWSKARMNSPDLTDEDLVIIEAFLTREWFMNTRMTQLSRSGFNREDLDVSARKWVHDYLGNQTGLRWWDMHSKHSGILVSNPELRSKIDQMLNELGDDHKLRNRKFMELLRGNAGSTLEGS